MGYTHYWTPKQTSEKKFKEFSETCKKLHDNLPERSESAGDYFNDKPIVIKGWDGTGEPIFDEKQVRFNGDESENLNHETFAIDFPDTDWNFCKTARKPYDLLVSACLLAAKQILGYEISSDGDMEDWKPAIEFYNSVVEENFVEESELSF
jgi:hypothetical protein